jgi:hypothetical protein
MDEKRISTEIIETETQRGESREKEIEREMKKVRKRTEEK